MWKLVKLELYWMILEIKYWHDIVLHISKENIDVKIEKKTCFMKSGAEIKTNY